MPSYPFTFGSFNYSCSQIQLVACPLLGSSPSDIVDPVCYSRNIVINNQVIFQPATLVVYILALIMTLVMIHHIKSKYTAVGRKEIVMFFYMYAAMTVLEFFLVSGIIPIGSEPFKYFSAVYIGLTISTIWCLLLNGFVGFQWAEDGTPLSLWSIRISSLIMGLITFFIAIGTFNEVAGFSKSSPVPLFFMLYIFSGAMICIYASLQIVLVVKTMDDRSPLVNIVVGILFFLMGKLSEYAFSTPLCQSAQHYIDGLFLGACFNLLTVMMVYKYWDSITFEDLEFSLTGKNHTWELKQPLLGNR